MGQREESIGRLVLLIHEAAAQLAKVAAAMSDIARAMDGVSPVEESVLGRGIAGLPSVNSRVYNALRWNGIDTIGQVLQHDQFFYLRLKNFGKGSLAQLEASLAELGLELPGRRR